MKHKPFLAVMFVAAALVASAQNSGDRNLTGEQRIERLEKQVSSLQQKVDDLERQSQQISILQQRLAFLGQQSNPDNDKFKLVDPGLDVETAHLPHPPR